MHDIIPIEQFFGAKKDPLKPQLILFQHSGREIYALFVYAPYSLISLQ